MKRKNKDLQKLMDEATAYDTYKNKEFTAKERDKVLMIKIDPDNNRADITICFTGHKDFPRMEYESDVIINLSENTIIKNRFKQI